jgi:hypothetical protein
MLCGIGWDDGEPVDLTLESHDLNPSLKNVAEATVEKLIHTLGMNVALVVNVKHVLRKVLGCLSPDLLAARFNIKARIVARALTRIVIRSV